MSDGLPLPHIQAVSDGGAGVGDGQRRRAHSSRPADTGTDEKKRELVPLTIMTLSGLGRIQRNWMGGFFFLACEDFGRMFDHSFPACSFFFFVVEISPCTLVPLFMPGSVYSGSAG